MSEWSFCKKINKFHAHNLLGVGASDNPCSETHAGPVAFSDPESRALRDFYEARKDDIKVYLAFHSYGQYILSPWGYTYDHVHNYDQLMQIGKMIVHEFMLRMDKEMTLPKSKLRCQRQRHISFLSTSSSIPSSNDL